MSQREDCAIAAALDTPEGDAALRAMMSWGDEGKRAVHLIRRAINRAYASRGLRAPEIGTEVAPAWEPRK